MKVNGNSNLDVEKIKNFNRCIVAENPLRDDAFDLNDAMKIERISEKFKDIMEILGLDLDDDTLEDTPLRVAKMYVNEVFKGLDPKKKPKITVFENKYGYHSPLIELNIPFTSFCEHHFVPIQGKANIAYMPKDFVVGLSKLHRVVDYFAKRPQVQERLTMQILQELTNVLRTDDVGVVLKASHSCIACRGVQDQGTSTLTSAFTGRVAADSNLTGDLRRFD